MTDPAAALFDIDGTLVDSNYLHVTAWLQAFTRWAPGGLLAGPPQDRHGLVAADLNPPRRRRGGTGRPGKAAPQRLLPAIRPFDHARELVTTVAGHGVKAVFVGDAVWDVVAAKPVGVPTIGLLSGGTSAVELLDAGAVAVYADAAALLHELDGSLLATLW